MEQWKRLGAFIGKHMAYFVPLCVVAGVLFPGVFGPLKAIVPLIFAAMTFQGALNNTFEQLLAARILHGSQPLLATMSFTCGMRNISSGAVIAAQYFPGETVFPVMCGTLFQQVLAATFGHIIERLCADQREQGERRVREARRLLASRGRR